MTAPLIRSCLSCRWSEPLVSTGSLVCGQADVNVPHGATAPVGAYLAGRIEVRRSCVAERGAKRGVCGPLGKLWAPRPDDLVPPDA